MLNFRSLFKSNFQIFKRYQKTSQVVNFREVITLERDKVNLLFELNYCNFLSTASR